MKIFIKRGIFLIDDKKILRFACISCFSKILQRIYYTINKICIVFKIIRDIIRARMSIM